MYRNIKIACFEASDWTLLKYSDSNLRHHLKGSRSNRWWAGCRGSPVTPLFSWGRRSWQWPPRVAEGSQWSFRQPSSSQLWPLRTSTQARSVRRSAAASGPQHTEEVQLLPLLGWWCCGEIGRDVGAQQPEDGDRFHSFSIYDVRGMTCLCLLKSIMTYIQFQVVFWARAGQILYLCPVHCLKIFNHIFVINIFMLLCRVLEYTVFILWMMVL